LHGRPGASSRDTHLLQQHRSNCSTHLFHQHQTSCYTNLLDQQRSSCHTHLLEQRPSNRCQMCRFQPPPLGNSGRKKVGRQIASQRPPTVCLTPPLCNRGSPSRSKQYPLCRRRKLAGDAALCAYRHRRGTAWRRQRDVLKHLLLRLQQQFCRLCS